MTTQMRVAMFDLDGTLVDQASAAAAAVVGWAADLGFSDDDVVKRWAEISDRHYNRYQRREVTFAQQRRARVCELFESDLDDEAADAMFAGYLLRYEDGWRAYDDAVPALRRARAAGLVVAILTNGDEAHQRHKLATLRLSAEVDELISSSTLPAGKPDPRAFRLAAERLAVEPARVLMIGDSLAKDVLGARAVGMSAVLLDRYDAQPGVEVARVASLDDIDFEPAAVTRRP